MTKSKFQLLSFIGFLLLFSSCNRDKPLNQTGKIYRHAAVVCAYPDAAKVGAGILKQGGNAVDAAVAVSFALEVVYPCAGNIGGGGFMVLRLSDGETNALDYREKAPAAATRDMYLDEKGNVIQDLSLTGHKAVGVPGAVAGLYKAHAKYGKLPWKNLLQPAIDLARNGFCLTKREAESLNSVRDNLQRENPQSKYLQNDNGWKEGDVLVQADLAHTLETIRDNGADGFYKGAVADSLVAEMQRGGGLITADDLNNYEAVWRKPISGTYKGYGIISMPPPSSGGIALMQLLKMIEPFNLQNMGFHSAGEVHLLTEAENRVYADRATWLGDPDFFHVPLTQLLDSVYIKNRFSNYNNLMTTPASAINAGNFVGTEKPETTHFSIVDQWGNAVAITTTLNGNYGSRVFVSGCGFLLNDEMDDFSVKPGAPNMFGLVGGKANAIEPNKRMLSSMTPTIINKNGKLFMVLGTPGGSTIITTVFQTILNVIDYHQGMQQAVTSKRFHSQWLPDEIQIESGAVSDNAIMQLEKMGHKCNKTWRLGCCDAILILANGEYETGADPRGDDTAAGW